MRTQVTSRKSDQSLINLKDELHKLTQCPVDTVPKGWRPRSAYEQAWNVSTSVAGKLIQAGVNSGKMEMRKFRIHTNRGGYVTPHYREV